MGMQRHDTRRQRPAALTDTDRPLHRAPRTATPTRRIAPACAGVRPLDLFLDCSGPLTLGIGEQPEPLVSQQHAGEHEPRDRCHEHRDDDFRERESVRSGTTHVDHDSA